MFVIHFWLFTSSQGFKINTEITYTPTPWPGEGCDCCENAPIVISDLAQVSAVAPHQFVVLWPRRWELLWGVSRCVSTHLLYFSVKGWWDCSDKLPGTLSCHSLGVLCRGHLVLRPHIHKIWAVWFDAVLSCLCDTDCVCVSFGSPCFKNGLLDLEDKKIRGAGELENREMWKYDVVENGKIYWVDS